MNVNATIRTSFLLAAAWALASCGGGGGGEAAPAPAPPTAPAADARNGDYRVYSTDGREYLLSLDFDAKTYRYAGGTADNGGAIDSGGKLEGSGSDYALLPADSSSAGTTNTFRLHIADDAVLGNFTASRYGYTGGTAPFLASRSFVRSFAEAEGRYVLLNRRVFSLTFPPPGLTTRQAEITQEQMTVRGGEFFPPAGCASSNSQVLGGALSLQGDLFTWHHCGGTYNFRIAKIGRTLVFLQAGAWPETGHSHTTIGFHESAVPAFGTYAAGGTDATWGELRVTSADIGFTGVRTNGTPDSFGGQRTGSSTTTPPLLLYREAAPPGPFQSAERRAFATADLAVVQASGFLRTDILPDSFTPSDLLIGRPRR